MWHDAVMGKFDGSIKWLMDQIKSATDALGDLNAGRKIEMDGVDVSNELKADYKKRIDRYKELIRAYQKRDE
jgi:hypothetical protein